MSVNSNGTPLLTVVVRKGHHDLVRYLIKREADVNARDENENTPLMVAIQHLSDSNSNALSDMLYILEQLNAKALPFSPSYPKTVVAAAQKGSIQAFEMLEAYANYPCPDGQLPLAIAAKNMHPEFVTYLIDKGASVDAISRHPSPTASMQYPPSTALAHILHQPTPFDPEGQNTYVEVIRRLIEHGADVNWSDSEENTPLMIAIQNRNIMYFSVRDAILSILQEAGAKALPNSLNYPDTVATSARTGSIQAFEMLEADVNFSHSDEPTLLSIGARCGHSEFVLYLINNGADVNTICEEQSLEPYHPPITRGTALSQALQTSGTHRTHEEWQEHVQIVQYLVEGGTNINLEGDQAALAVLLSNRLIPKLRKIDLARVLVSHGADIGPVIDGPSLENKELVRAIIQEIAEGATATCYPEWHAAERYTGRRDRIVSFLLATKDPHSAACTHYAKNELNDRNTLATGASEDSFGILDYLQPDNKTVLYRGECISAETLLEMLNSTEA